MLEKEKKNELEFLEFQKSSKFLKHSKIVESPF